MLPLKVSSCSGAWINTGGQTAMHATRIFDPFEASQFHTRACGLKAFKGSKSSTREFATVHAFVDTNGVTAEIT